MVETSPQQSKTISWQTSKEQGARRKEKGERRKEKGERRKEKGEKSKPLSTPI
jgi:hypothetical protein